MDFGPSSEEFDAYDEDRSGYIDVKELKGLLEKLGEELSEEELDQDSRFRAFFQRFSSIFMDFHGISAFFSPFS